MSSKDIKIKFIPLQIDNNKIQDIFTKISKR